MSEMNVGKKVAIGAGIAAGAAGAAATVMAVKKGKLKFSDVADTFTKTAEDGSKTGFFKKLTTAAGQIFNGIKEGFVEIKKSIVDKFGKVKKAAEEKGQEIAPKIEDAGQ